MPNMRDPRFERAVILMCAHDENEAMGVIVNKPVDRLTMGDLLEKLEIIGGEPLADEPVRFGGPVQTDRGLVIHTLDYRIEGTLAVTAKIGLTASREILLDLIGRGERPAPRRYFLAVGYAGWGAGQLEDEIIANAWVHCSPDEDIVFAEEPEQAWRRSLERLGVSGAMLSPEWAFARSDDAPLN